MSLLVAAVISTAVGMPSLGFAAEVEATLDRDAVPAGNGALLTLTMSGGNVGQIELPEVENFIIQGRDQSLSGCAGPECC